MTKTFGQSPEDFDSSFFDEVIFLKKYVAMLLAVIMLFGLVACTSPNKAIVGTWKSQNTVLGVVTETKYVFNEGGTGTISTFLNVDFTYAFAEDKLIITTVALGIESSDVYSFAFDGDKLTLSNDEETVILEKVS